MRRGILRIIVGSILTLFQIISTIYWYSSANHYLYSPGFNNFWIGFWYYVGFYSIGITGIFFLFFGIRAYKKGLRSQLILHAKTKTIHTVSRWITFTAIVVTMSLLVIDCISDLKNSYGLETLVLIYVVLTFCSYLSFAIYLLFYIHKKPCCLFSTSLLFLGLSYLTACLEFNPLSDILALLETSTLAKWQLLNIFLYFSSTIAGILYIIIAAKLYKEDFSINVIKTLGWVVFVIDLSSKLLFPVLAFGYFYFYYRDIILITGLFFFASIFRMNTLKQGVKTMICDKCNHTLPEDSEFCQYCGTPITPVNSIVATEDSKIVEPTTTDKVKTKTRFCSRCGSQIDNETKKCTGCGKQYFKGIRFNRTFYIVLSFSIALLIAIAVIVYQNNKINVLKEESSDLNDVIGSLNGDIDEWRY